MHAAVTGASSGIGAALVAELRSRSHRGTGLARSGAEVQCDLRDPETIPDVWEALCASCGVPGALVNNAGVAIPGSLLELDATTWDEQFAVNVRAAVLLTQAFVRSRRERGGVIVNVASTAGMGARSGRSAYAASKAALISFSQSMAEELRPWGFRVLTVCPGPCATPLRRELFPDEDPAAIMQPREAAAAIVDLMERAHVVGPEPVVVRC